MKRGILFLIIVALSISLVSAAGLDCSGVQSIGIVGARYVVDLDKVNALFNSSLSYDCVKRILGLEPYDFYIEITDITGVYLIDDSHDLVLIYGIYPGKTQDDFIKSFSADSIGHYFGFDNPSYTPFSGGGGGGGEHPQSGGPTGFGIPGSPTPEEIQRQFLFETISPDLDNFESVSTFERTVLIKQGFTFNVGKLVLGVWSEQ